MGMLTSVSVMPSMNGWYIVASGGSQWSGALRTTQGSLRRKCTEEEQDVHRGENIKSHHLWLVDHPQLCVKASRHCAGWCCCPLQRTPWRVSVIHTAVAVMEADILQNMCLKFFLFWRFMMLTNIHSYGIKEFWRHGEAGFVDLAAVAAEQEQVSKILARYDVKDCFNFDETGLFALSEFSKLIWMCRWTNSWCCKQCTTRPRPCHRAKEWQDER